MVVARHRTAIARSTLSAPIQSLGRRGLLSGSFFDYGCGRGDDVRRLRSIGVDASGWDPHFCPSAEQRAADIVNLGFVLNVIEDEAERAETLRVAFRLARKLLVVAVRLVERSSPGEPFRDGLLTSRGTFQKYFTQPELLRYIEQVLRRPSHSIGRGIALVYTASPPPQLIASLSRSSPPGSGRSGSPGG